MKNKRTKQINRSTEDKKKRRIRPTPKKGKKDGEKRGETIKGNQRRKKQQKKNKDRNIDQFQPNTTQIFSEKKKKKQIDPICTGTCQDDPKFLYHNKSQKRKDNNSPDER